MSRSLFATVGALFSITDEQAMWRVHMHDDAHAFAQLVSRWEGPIQRLCTRMLGDGHRGEDLCQDTFARVFAKRKDYQPSGRFSTYLWRIALNLCYDELRRLKRRPEATLGDQSLDELNPSPHLPVESTSPDALLRQREERDIVRHAVMQLPETYRCVVILRHYENLKFREIADVLGIPEGTVKSRMAEALTQLHRTLVPVLNEKGSVVCNSQIKPRMQESLVL